MTDTPTRFLADAATLRSVSVDELLTELLHLDQAEHLKEMTGCTDDSTFKVLSRLDREVRLRNPGLHYVVRDTYCGYRREQATPGTAGERTQVFMSVLRRAASLDVVLPLKPSDYLHLPFAQDVSGQGHHGVGDLKCSIVADNLGPFLEAFDGWLTPVV